MAETTWKQAVYDIADAYREAEGTEDKISIANLKEKVREGSSKVTLDGEKVKELAMTSYKGANPLTIGADGATFDPNVLLQAGLQIINGVNGEDLTDTAADQTLAVENLLKMVNRKVGEKNGIGEYVWKRQKIVEKVITNPIIQLCGFTPFKVKSSEVYLPLVTEEFFDGFALNNPSFPGYNFEYTNGVLYQYTGGTQKSVAKFDPVALTITNVNGVGGSYAASGEDFVYTGDKVCPTLSDEVEFLVSYDESAYPSNEVLDGYLYEKIKEGASAEDFGYSKIDYGSFMVSSDTQFAGYKIPHSLETTPYFVMIFSKEVITAQYCIVNIIVNRVWDNDNGDSSDTNVGSLQYVMPNYTNYSPIKISRGSIDYTNTDIAYKAYSGLTNTFKLAGGKRYYWLALV